MIETGLLFILVAVFTVFFTVMAMGIAIIALVSTCKW